MIQNMAIAFLLLIFLVSGTALWLLGHTWGLVFTLIGIVGYFMVNKKEK